MSLTAQISALATAVGQAIKSDRARLAALEAAGGGGGGGGGGVTVYEKSADQAFSTTALADIADWVIPLPANTVVTLDGILVFQSAATTTGFGFAATPRTVGNAGALTPNKFLVTFEYQTAAGTWATFTQTSPTAPMAVTSSSYVANSGIMCRITGQIDVGPVDGELHLQARSEVAGSAITVRKGSPIRVM